jgi:8-oxo-dGTP diphosphatase
MKKQTHMVAGFLFNRNEVALIRKKRPAWQAGKLNGIGGHVEPGETPEAAMAREFCEETGAEVKEWHKFCILTIGDAVVHFFAAEGTPVLKSLTDEPVRWWKQFFLQSAHVVPNLAWLIPLAKYSLENPTVATVHCEKV